MSPSQWSAVTILADVWCGIVIIGALVVMSLIVRVSICAVPRVCRCGHGKISHYAGDNRYWEPCWECRCLRWRWHITAW